MNEDYILEGPEQAPKAGGAPEQLVVFLHGYGANGHDLIDLSMFFGNVLPQAQFLAPNAPQPCAMAPVGLQWFALYDAAPEQQWQGLLSASDRLDRYLDQQLDRFSLREADLALVGFSQGTMLALHCGLRRDNVMAGILGYSGRLMGADRLKGEIRAKPPVKLIHGADDDVVPSAESGYAMQVLHSLGLSVSMLECPDLGHGIDDTGLKEGCGYLGECFR